MRQFALYGNDLFNLRGIFRNDDGAFRKRQNLLQIDKRRIAAAGNIDGTERHNPHIGLFPLFAVVGNKTDRLAAHYAELF